MTHVAASIYSSQKFAWCKQPNDFLRLMQFIHDNRKLLAWLKILQTHYRRTIQRL